MYKLSVDEYIFIMWVRSLSETEQLLFHELLLTGNIFLLPFCIGFLKSYPHDLLKIAIAIGN